MTMIGSFVRNSDDSCAGTVKTLALDLQLRLEPLDPAPENDKAPSHRAVTAGGSEAGAAWRRTSREDRPNLAVKLDNPSFTAPTYANLFEGEDGNNALIWSRWLPRPRHAATWRDAADRALILCGAQARQ